MPSTTGDRGGCRGVEDRHHDDQDIPTHLLPPTSDAERRTLNPTSPARHHNQNGLHWNKFVAIALCRKGALGKALSTGFEFDLVASLPRLRRFAYALTGSIHEGDELVQAACERALRKADRFEQGTRMDSWLFRIVQNLWLDSKRRERTRGDQIDPELAALSDEGLAARRPEDRMMLTRVRQAVGELPDEQRLVLALVAIDGMTYREAAGVLDLPIGTVMSRLSRARTNLSRILEEPRPQ